jgi:hypothetical protein
MTRHDDFLACHRVLLDALAAEQRNRARNPDDWELRERAALVNAANRWVDARTGLRHVDAEAVERVEPRAMGHIDYSSKIALYVAQLVYGLPGGPDV